MRRWSSTAGPTLLLGVVLATPVHAQALPADADHAVDRLNASPRHGEWVRYAAGAGDSVLAWVVYPERRDPAPVVVVIHEIFGLTDWVRGVADQLAAEGYVAIAPDLLSGKGPDGGATASVDQQGAVRLIRELDRAEVFRRLRAAAAYATALPAAKATVATIGFCWGGSTSFGIATDWPDLTAAVVYYGTSPDDAALSEVHAAVLGLYGGDDARVLRTVDPARTAMTRLGKSYEAEVYDGAGHGFLRAQQDRDGANARAAERAWPRTIAFLRERIGR